MPSIDGYKSQTKTARKNACSKMDGQFWHLSKPPDGGARQKGKITKLDGSTGQKTEQNCVEAAAQSKHQTSKTIPSRGNDDVRIALLITANKLRYRVRPVLAIGIHDQNGTARKLPINMVKTHRNRHLVPDVAAQSNHFAGEASVY